MSYKFIKTKDERNQFDQSTITYEVEDCVVLSDLVEEFSFFLKACGYHFEELEVIFKEEEKE